jgi:hypothetical protein
MTTQASWHEAYKSAVLETDWTKTEQKIQDAEDGIGARLHEFSRNHSGTPEENRAIEDTLNGLDLLRNEVATRQESKRTGVG